MNSKKTIIIALLAVALGAAGWAYYNTSVKTVEVGVSKVKASPDAYLGRVSITGKAGKVWADKGVFELVDDKACCNIYVLVPANEAQKKEFEAKHLYSGTMPSSGQPLKVRGELSKEKDGYMLVVDRVDGDSGTLIRKI